MPKVKLREIVIASTASTDSAMSRDVFGSYNFAPSRTSACFAPPSKRPRRGTCTGTSAAIVSSDVFYHPDGPKVTTCSPPTACSASRWRQLRYIRWRPFRPPRTHPSAPVSDSLVTHEQIDPEARQTSLREMAELALTVATGA